MVKRKILNADGSVMLVKVDLATGFKGDVDQHPEEQLSYIEKGIVEFTVDSKVQVVKQGDVVYIPSNVKHQVNVIEECTILDIFTPIRTDLLSH